MSLIRRFCYLLLVTCLIVLWGSDITLAEVCPQERYVSQAPDNIYNLINPLGNKPDVQAKGEKLYHWTAKPLPCANCHGINGNAKGMMARSMTPKPRNFSCKIMMKDIPDGQLFWIIRKGSPGTGMLPYNKLNDDQIWQLVAYIRHFSK
jgi:mono/diheme cytochrome c family protein